MFHHVGAWEHVGAAGGERVHGSQVTFLILANDGTLILIVRIISIPIFKSAKTDIPIPEVFFKIDLGISEDPLYSVIGTVILDQ